MSEPILLDTHVWIWLITGEKKLRNVDRLRESAREKRLYLSPISCWELGMLVSRGRIQLQMPCNQWAAESMRKGNLLAAPLSPEAAVEASYLPGNLHQDPADRLLIATARGMEASLATRDEKILAYGRDGYVKTLRA